jgi:hypothetical protein
MGSSWQLVLRRIEEKSWRGLSVWEENRNYNGKEREQWEELEQGDLTEH